MTPPELQGEATGKESSVFFGNIKYDCEEDDLKNTLRTAGPYRDMKLMFGEDQKMKGFGFCTYNDPDTAASALRNLGQVSIKNRELKASYASDRACTTNLKPEDVRDRDPGEIIGKTHQLSLSQGELMKPQNSSVDDMVRSLSDIQKELLIFSIQDSYNHLKKSSPD